MSTVALSITPRQEARAHVRAEAERRRWIAIGAATREASRQVRDGETTPEARATRVALPRLADVSPLDVAARTAADEHARGAHAIITLRFARRVREPEMIAAVRQYLDRLCATFGHVRGVYGYELDDVRSPSWVVTIAAVFERAPSEAPMAFAGVSPLAAWTEARWQQCHDRAGSTSVRYVEGNPGCPRVARSSRAAVYDTFNRCPAKLGSRYRRGPHRASSGCTRRAPCRWLAGDST